jgi:hypothetical protein
MNIQLRGNIAVSDSGFVFNPSTGDSYSMNAIGVEVIRHLQTRRNTTEIIEAITASYDTESQTVEKDLYDFYSMLIQHQLADKV